MRPTRQQHTVSGSPGLSTLSWVGLVLTGAVAVFALALALGGGAPRPVPAGLPDSGLLTGWLLELGRFTVRTAAVGAVGCLLVAAVLAPSHGPALSPAARRGLRLGGRLSLVWGAATLAVYVLHVAELTGSGLLPDGLTPLTDRLVTTPEGITTLLVVTLTLHVGTQALAARTPAMAALLPAGALAAVLPPVAVGHVQSSADPGLAASSMALHVLTATVWIGGLAALLLLLRRDPSALAVAAGRFSTVALLCFTGLVLSGLLAALDRITSPTQLLTSSYGLLLLLKSVLTVALGVVGARHRAQTVHALRTRPAHGRPFLRLALGELVVMAVALALAVALASTPPPGGNADLWRPDAIVAFSALVAVSCYVGGARALSRRAAWDPWRTGSFAAGVGVAAAALSIGGTTSATAAMLQLLVLIGLSGPLLAVGHPAELARRALVAAPAGASGDLREALSAMARVARSAPAWSALLLVEPWLLVVATGRQPQHHVRLLLCLSAVVGGALLARKVLDSSPRSRTLNLLVGCAGLLLLSAQLNRSGEPKAAAVCLTFTLVAFVGVLMHAPWPAGAGRGPRRTQVLGTRG